jgi:ubiquinone/menaquinone biosynthesis C-methylase UbiE
VCVDFNRAVWELGSERAEREDSQFDFLQADLTAIRVPQNAFDVVVCRAALHQVFNLEQLGFSRVKGAQSCGAGGSRGSIR